MSVTVILSISSSVRGSCVAASLASPHRQSIDRVSFCGHPVRLQCLGRVWQLPWSVSPQTARSMAQSEWSSCLSSVLGSCASRGTHGHPLLKSTSSGTCHIPVILSLHTLSLNPRGNRHTSGPAGRRNTPASTCVQSLRCDAAGGDGPRLLPRQCWLFAEGNTIEVSGGRFSWAHETSTFSVGVSEEVKSLRHYTCGHKTTDTTPSIAQPQKRQRSTTERRH